MGFYNEEYRERILAIVFVSYCRIVRDIFEIYQILRAGIYVIGIYVYVRKTATTKMRIIYQHKGCSVVEWGGKISLDVPRIVKRAKKGQK